MEMCFQISVKTGHKVTDIHEIIDELIEVMKEGLSQGEIIYMRGFGALEVKHRKQKIARNFVLNKPAIVPAHKTVGFKIYKPFKDKLNKSIK